MYISSSVMVGFSLCLVCRSLLITAALVVFVLVKDNHSAGVQRAEDADGDEQHAVRRAHGLVQSRPPAREWKRIPQPWTCLRLICLTLLCYIVCLVILFLYIYSNIVFTFFTYSFRGVCEALCNCVLRSAI